MHVEHVAMLDSQGTQIHEHDEIYFERFALDESI